MFRFLIITFLSLSLGCGTRNLPSADKVYVRNPFDTLAWKFDYSIFGDHPKDYSKKEIHNGNSTGSINFGSSDGRAELIFIAIVVVAVVVIGIGSAIYENAIGAQYLVTSDVPGYKIRFTLLSGDNLVGFDQRVIDILAQGKYSCQIQACGNRSGTKNGLMYIKQGQLIIEKKLSN